ncbi:unnamed protein product [Peronospora belbahrii]|uniref:RCC1-like domain-containing protein n=1 Tax=Peronospora belbahrii TaxID=622444 RepID=A0AAU9LRY3_9STRA|nr:unnamed protein product [Peronospora belbahrii]CAH0520955.1 unnamed protein product [Peronospora belbahrii]
MSTMAKRLYVWGSGGSGQLGVGTKDDYTLPQCWNNKEVSVQIESITSGGCHSAGIHRDGRLFLWGSDDRGQLGRIASDRGQNVVHAPSQHVECLPHDSKTRLVACGWWNTLAVVSSIFNDNQGDRVFSWGSNDHHQLGRKESSDRNQALDSAQIGHLPSRLQVASIACGWKHSLLATAEGDVFAWGSGRHGQLALGTDTLVAYIPQRIHALTNTTVSNVFCGWEHSVFQSSKGEVFTCGNNRHGQLGVQEVSVSATIKNPSERRKQVNALPVRVPAPGSRSEGLRTMQISCGWHYVLCLTESEELVAWGKGSHGQLGLGQFVNANKPTKVAFSHAIRQIACGSEHSMVVTRNGDLYTCGWGEHGNLGHGDNTNRATLDKVAFFENTNQEVISVVAGGAVSLAVASARRPSESTSADKPLRCC